MSIRLLLQLRKKHSIERKIHVFPQSKSSLSELIPSALKNTEQKINGENFTSINLFRWNTPSVAASSWPAVNLSAIHISGFFFENTIKKMFPICQQIHHCWMHLLSLRLFTENFSIGLFSWYIESQFMAAVTLGFRADHATCRKSSEMSGSYFY